MFDPISELFTVSAVARQLAIAPSTLRTWDRRYGLGPSVHQAGTHRKYSALDLSKLTLMRRLIVSGLSPVDAAGAALKFIGEVLPPKIYKTESSKEDLVALLYRAANALELDMLEERILAEIKEHGISIVWESVLSPLLVRIGKHWEETHEGVEIEHLVSEKIRRILNESQAKIEKPINSRPVVLACVENETHSLPLQALCAVLAEVGIQSHFLGARTPAISLNQLIKRTAPPAIFLWASMKELAIVDQINNLPSFRPAPKIILGGPGWSDKDCGSATISLNLKHAHEQISRAIGV